MIKQYLFNDTVYTTEREVREAIWQKDRKAIGSPKADSQKEFWSKHGVVYTENEVVLTEKQKVAQEMFAAKQQRRVSVATIIVEVDGMTFDGSEVSQDRMLRCIHVLNDNVSIPWVLADNTVKQVRKHQLEKALQLAVEQQCAIWTLPYKE